MKTAFRRLANGGANSSESDCQDIAGEGLGRSPRLFSTARSKQKCIKNIDDEGLVHVPMDFRGSCGKIVSCADMKEERDRKFLRGASRRSHSGFREHKQHFPLQIPWFHNELGREEAGSALIKYGQIDGSFLVRPCGKLDGVSVLSYLHSSRVYHTKIHLYTEYDLKLFSLDDGKTKFMDLIQLIHFYQENKGTLMTRLTHYLESGQPVQPVQQIQPVKPVVPVSSSQHNHKDPGGRRNQGDQIFLSPEKCIRHDPEE